MCACSVNLTELHEVSTLLTLQIAIPGLAVWRETLTLFTALFNGLKRLRQQFSTDKFTDCKIFMKVVRVFFSFGIPITDVLPHTSGCFWPTGCLLIFLQQLLWWAGVCWLVKWNLSRWTETFCSWSSFANAESTKLSFKPKLFSAFACWIQHWMIPAALFGVNVKIAMASIRFYHRMLSKEQTWLVKHCTNHCFSWSNFCHLCSPYFHVVLVVTHGLCKYELFRFTNSDLSSWM